MNGVLTQIKKLDILSIETYLLAVRWN